MEIKDVMKERIFSDEKMKKVNLFDTKNMFCDVYCVKPGQNQKIHSHKNEDKVYYVLEGEGKFTVGDEEKILRAGEITIAPKGEQHGVINDSHEDLSILVFMAPNPNY